MAQFTVLMSSKIVKFELEIDFSLIFMEFVAQYAGVLSLNNGEFEL